MDNLNSDLLRTFLAVAETGSVTAGAGRVHRSQSAVSLQIGRLEEVLGQPVFVRHGRGVRLTEAGQDLLPVAREVTQMLGRAYRRLTADRLGGTLRIGLPEDQSQGRLTRIVGAFAQSHPLVELRVSCALSAGFPQALEHGQLDLAVFATEAEDPGEEVLRSQRTRWAMARDVDVLDRDPLPVALFDQACWWRDAALGALHRMDRPYRVVFSSQNDEGVRAAIEAGIAVGLLGEDMVTPGLRALGGAEGFADPPLSRLVMRRAPGADGPAVAAMEEAIREAFAGA